MKGSLGKSATNPASPKPSLSERVPPSPHMLRSPRSNEVDPVTEDSEGQKMSLETYATAMEKLSEAATVISRTAAMDSANELSRSLQDYPVLEADLASKAVVLKLAKLFVRGEAKRAQVLGELNSYFAVPMKQVLRVEVSGLREMQERVEAARQELDEAQLRFDIARSSKKKKALVDKLAHELETARTQHSLLKLNLTNKWREFETKRRFDSLQRLMAVLTQYGEMFEMITQDFARLSAEVKEAQAQLQKSKGSWEKTRAQVDVDEILEDQMHGLEMERQGYVDVAQQQGFSVAGAGGNRFKKMWMVASQGMVYLYQTWKDESAKSQFDLVTCSAKLESEGSDTFQLVGPNEMAIVKCQTPDEAEAWLAVIRKGNQYKLKKLQEEKRLNDPAAIPDYLKEMQMLSPENKLCADCGARNPEWASMTLGVLVCEDCCGVHRQLGTHISRTRSLTIDVWTEEQYYVLKQFGNEFANRVWENTLAADSKVSKRLGSKPAASASREERETYIRTKYVDKRWLQPRPSAWKNASGVELAERLYDFGSRNDLKSMFFVLAHGGNSALVLESGRNTFQQLIVDGSATVYTLQLLLLHSNELHKRDASGLDALQLAVQQNNPHIVKFLQSQGFDTNSKTATGLSLRELAVQSKADDVVSFFSTGVLPSKEDPNRLRKNALMKIEKIVAKLAENRVALGELQDADKIFEIAKKIRMIKIGVQQLETDGFLK